MLQNLHNQDFYLWIEYTVSLLRDRNYAKTDPDIDWDNLIDELHLMGEREKNTLRIELRGLLRYMIKYAYFPKLRSPQIVDKIEHYRDEIVNTLQESPSLKDFCQEIFTDCYKMARLAIALELDVEDNFFPIQSPWTLEESLKPKFFPS